MLLFSEFSSWKSSQGEVLYPNITLKGKRCPTGNLYSNVFIQGINYISKYFSFEDSNYNDICNLLCKFHQGDLEN